MLRKSSGNSGFSNGIQSSVGLESSTLDGKISSTLGWSSRVYEISDLQIDRERTDNVFLCTFSLDRLDGSEISGRTQNPDPPTQFSLKAEGKEVALLSGLLGRHCRILELRYQRLISQSELVAEIQALREENSNLQQEVENLYGALESLQRPKMIST
jgi:hypothetical protein